MKKKDFTKASIGKIFYMKTGKYRRLNSAMYVEENIVALWEDQYGECGCLFESFASIADHMVKPFEHKLDELKDLHKILEYFKTRPHSEILVAFSTAFDQ